MNIPDQLSLNVAMNLEEYARKISFRLLQPTTSCPPGFQLLSRLARKTGLQPEMWMTRLPEEHGEMRRRLKGTCAVHRMSTFAIGALINRAVAAMRPDQAYLNIGVWKGFTFFAGMAGHPDKTCIGVDNFSNRNPARSSFLARFEATRTANHHFHEADFREYLVSRHRSRLGVYMFDGPHSYQDQLDGLTLAEPFFDKGCVILVDDTNWSKVREANLDFIRNSSFQYRILFDVQTSCVGHPTFWNGLMILERC